MRKTWLKFLVYIAKNIYHFNNKIIYFCEVYVYKTRKNGDYLPELGEIKKGTVSGLEIVFFIQ